MADVLPITAALFWSKVAIPENKVDCWNWTGVVADNGYGRFHNPEIKTWARAHRMAYEMLKGEIPEGLQIRHMCHNKLCCNPNHLDVGTAVENVADSIAAGRFPRGSTHGKSKLTEDQVIEIRQNRDSLTTRQLAERYSVAVGTISGIRNGKGWRHA